MAPFTRKLRWEVNFHFETKFGDAWILKWRSLNLSCLTGGKKFTFKLSGSTSFLYCIVGQKRFLSLSNLLLLDLTNHSIGSFVSNLDISSGYGNCHLLCNCFFLCLSLNIVQNYLKNMCLWAFGFPLKSGILQN